MPIRSSFVLNKCCADGWVRTQVVRVHGNKKQRGLTTTLSGPMIMQVESHFWHIIRPFALLPPLPLLRGRGGMGGAGRGGGPISGPVRPRGGGSLREGGGPPPPISGLARRGRGGRGEEDAMMSARLRAGRERSARPRRERSARLRAGARACAPDARARGCPHENAHVCERARGRWVCTRSSVHAVYATRAAGWACACLL